MNSPDNQGTLLKTIGATHISIIGGAAALAGIAPDLKVDFKRGPDEPLYLLSPAGCLCFVKEVGLNDVTDVLMEQVITWVKDNRGDIQTSGQRFSQRAQQTVLPWPILEYVEAQSLVPVRSEFQPPTAANVHVGNLTYSFDWDDKNETWAFTTDGVVGVMSDLGSLSSYFFATDAPIVANAKVVIDDDLGKIAAAARCEAQLPMDKRNQVKCSTPIFVQQTLEQRRAQCPRVPITDSERLTKAAEVFFPTAQITEELLHSTARRLGTAAGIGPTDPGHWRITDCGLSTVSYNTWVNNINGLSKRRVAIQRPPLSCPELTTVIYCPKVISPAVVFTQGRNTIDADDAIKKWKEREVPPTPITRSETEMLAVAEKLLEIFQSSKK